MKAAAGFLTVTSPAKSTWPVSFLRPAPTSARDPASARRRQPQQVKRVAEKFKDHSDVAFLSFTVNPEQDTVEALADYKRKLKTGNNQWHFLTGQKDSIYSLAAQGYLVYAAQGKEAGQFFHSQDLILVDKEMRIRGVYDGLDTKDVDTLIDEINVLLYQYKDKK